MKDDRFAPATHAAPPPLVSVRGTARESGRELGALWREQLEPVGSSVAARRYAAPWWDRATGAQAKLIDQRAPHLRALLRGMAEGAGFAGRDFAARTSGGEVGGCSSFAIAPHATRAGSVIAGQTKDTPLDRIAQYIVLQIELSDGPCQLTLTYPGDLLGHGFYNTGMAVYRNAMPPRRPETADEGGKPAPLPGGISFTTFGMLALSCRSLAEALELLEQHPFAGPASLLVSDAAGESAAIEFAEDGVGVVRPRDGILVHTNHFGCESVQNAPRWEPVRQSHSEYRLNRLQQLLEAQRGRLTPQCVFECLSDHEQHPYCICRHDAADMSDLNTTAAVVSEPALGRLHVTLGPPCRGSAVSFSMA